MVNRITKKSSQRETVRTSFIRMGTSEKVLAGFVKDLPRDSFLISDKFTPQCADASSPTAMKDMIRLRKTVYDKGKRLSRKSISIS